MKARQKMEFLTSKTNRPKLNKISTLGCSQSAVTKKFTAYCTSPALLVNPKFTGSQKNLVSLRVEGIDKKETLKKLMTALDDHFTSAVSSEAKKLIEVELSKL